MKKNLLVLTALLALTSCGSQAASLIPQSEDSAIPSVAPSIEPSVTPSVAPSVAPSVVPSIEPSVEPSVEPSIMPDPSAEYSMTPSVEPSVEPSIEPSEYPSEDPSEYPSEAPSVEPSVEPSIEPSVTPSILPSEDPSVAPSVTSELPPEEDPFYYEDFYDHSSEVKITIKLTNEHASRLCDFGSPYNVATQDIYHPCDVLVTVNGETREFKEAGIRIKGNMSRGDSADFFTNDGHINGGGHFKISFNQNFSDNDFYTPTEDEDVLKARRFGTAKKFDIKWNRNYDEKFTREAYASSILEDSGLMAQKINLAKIKFVTDTEEREFTYQVLETIDEEFLKRRLPKAEAKGDLYKTGWVNSDNNNLTSSSDYLMGAEDKATNKFFVYDLKTNKKKSTHESLKNLISALNSDDRSLSTEELKTKLESIIDIDYWLKFAAMEYLIGNPDSWRYHYNNTYLYFNSGNGKLYPIMFDNDRCFGITQDWYVNTWSRWPTTSKTSLWVEGGDMRSTQENPLYIRTIVSSDNERWPLVQEYQERYVQYVNEFANRYMNASTYNAFVSDFYMTDSVWGDNVNINDYFSGILGQINDYLNRG